MLITVCLLYLHAYTIYYIMQNVATKLSNRFYTVMPSTMNVLESGIDASRYVNYSFLFNLYSAILVVFLYRNYHLVYDI